MRKLGVYLFFILTTAGLFLRVYKTESIPFSDWDEGIYAQVAKEILQNRSLDTTFNDAVWLNKPPLSHLLIAASFKLFGFSEIASRAVFAFFGVLTLALLYLLSKKILAAFFTIKSSHLALLPPLILASTPIFLERSTTLNTDIIIATSYLGYFLYKDNLLKKTLFLLLGVWSKSLVGFFPLFIEPLLWLQKKINFKTLTKKILTLIFQIILASLWYFYAFAKHGQYFIKAHFLDQIFKRVAAPIELHFGNKWYYFKLLWENLNWISIILALALLAVLFDFAKLLLKKKFASVKDKRFVLFSILLSPLAFFALLTIGKSKIYWYLLFILPLFLLSFPYLFAKLPKNYRFFAVLPILLFSFFQFTKQTYLFKPNIKIGNKIKLAKCINKTRAQSLAFLVNEDERKIRNVLEAAQLQTETSFIYGGSPSFVFYANKKKLTYFYKIENFLRKFREYEIIALSQKDIPLIKGTLSDYNRICSFGEWEALEKKNL